MSNESMTFLNWQTYIIQLSKPYSIGHVEADKFSIQCLSELFCINIFLWDTMLKKLFHSLNQQAVHKRLCI